MCFIYCYNNIDIYIVPDMDFLKRKCKISSTDIEVQLSDIFGEKMVEHMRNTCMMPTISLSYVGMYVPCFLVIVKSLDTILISQFEVNFQDRTVLSILPQLCSCGGLHPRKLSHIYSVKKVCSFKNCLLFWVPTMWLSLHLLLVSNSYQNLHFCFCHHL